MEVMVPVSITTPDFNFDSTCSTPYMSAPSSPKQFGGDFYFSAPTSPARASAFYHDFNNLSFIDRTTNRASSIPFDWEETPGTPKSKSNKTDEDFAFDFNFSGHLERSSLSAEELFDDGKIRPLKPLKPPPRLQIENSDNRSSLASSPRSPRSPIEKLRKVFSPKQRKEIDPFAVAIEESRRGRERGFVAQSTKPSHRSSRSLSPFRAPWIEPEPEPETEQEQSVTKSSTKHASSASKGSKKWRLRDFLLFRSASEGRASDRDPLSKYAVVTAKKNEHVKNSSFRITVTDALVTKKTEDVKNSSFRSTDSSGSGSMRRGPLSAHELHYTKNRAVSEEMKRKTYLPYRQGLFGCMGFNPAVKGLARGFNV